MNDEIQIEIAAERCAQSVLVNNALIPISKKKADAFHDSVDRSGGPDACWLWKLSRNRDGYGTYEVKQKYIGAHRMAYQLHYGPIQKGVCVLHNCPNGDNPGCCNPAHLWLGSHTDNMRDMEKKGRARHPRGDESGKRKHPEATKRGSDCNLSKLTEDQVREIRALFGKLRCKEIAAKFNVTDVCVYGIAARKSWKHVA